MEDGEPDLHIWTGDEDIPEIVPAEIPAFAMAGSSPMPPSVVRSRSKGMKTSKLGTPGWKLVQADLAVVRGNLPAEDLKSAAVYSQELYVMLRSFIGGPDFSGLFSSRFFSEMRDYVNYAQRAGASTAESFYDPRSSEIVSWYRRFPTPALFQRAFAHEFTHAYVDRVWNRTSPLWFMEGLAEWFSNIHWRANIFVPGQMNNAALFILAGDMNDNKLSIERLISATRDDFYGYQFTSYYAQAWTLVDFIMTRMPGGTVQDMLAGDYPNLPSLQQEWEAHVRMMLS